MKILLLGSTGLLGSTLGPFLSTCGHEVNLHGYTHDVQYSVNLNDPKETNKLLENIKPEVIINLVGLTDVERCEAEPHQAYLANVRTIENIVNWIKLGRTKCYLVHVSTDHVYDGVSLHSELSVTLTNYYAFSKYAGELAAAYVPSTILRTNFFGRSQCARRNSLTDWIFRSLSKCAIIQVLDDVWFSPLSMDTLSEMIELVVKKRHAGVFNLGSHQGMSKADFAFSFAKELGLSTQTMTRTENDRIKSLKVYRPRDMRLDCSKFETVFGVRLPLLRDEIKRTAKEYL